MQDSAASNDVSII